MIRSRRSRWLTSSPSCTTAASCRSGRPGWLHRPPREIYDRPQSPFVADFIGSTNLIRGRVAGPVGVDLHRVDTTHGPIICTITEGAAPQTDVLVSIRPEDVVVRDGPPAGTPAGTWEAAG